jgi:outer membrane protein assembly factor BamB
MGRLLLAILLASMTFAPALAADWPWWRGPDRNGVADPKQSPPLRWGDDGVLWKVPVPGRGHGSAIVVGDQVFLAAAEPDRQVQSLLCFDRHNGKSIWRAEVHTGGGVEAKGNTKSTLASGTPACDGSRVFINFLNGGRVFATALDRRDGKQLWQVKLTDFVMHQGFGASPSVYGPLVLFAADHKGGGVIAGLDRESGKVVWRVDRPKLPNYVSPIVLPIAGADQLVLTGCDLVTGLDPLSGKTLWESKGSTTECVTSVVTDGTHVFTSGGYPKNHVSAVRVDGSGVAWENTTRVYVPSLVVRGKHLYGVQDGGVATCWECATGKPVWTGRLGGTFSASPVLVGDRLYAINEAGKTFVFRATPEKFELESEGQLGNEAFATPTICGGRIYIRVAMLGKDKGRQEWLYCLGTK